MTQYCPSCGNSNRDDARFCSRCGTALAGTTPFGARSTGVLPPNTLIANRYIIARGVGRGGMGAVYAAMDSRISSKVWAVKEMSEATITDPNERQQALRLFTQEATLLAQLDHPNLPKVSDHFTENGRQYLVMDFVDGVTLQTRLQQQGGPLDGPLVVDWGVQLCNVLEYLHSRQPPIIFRDLKPANIMVDSRNCIKLIDFGIARLFNPRKSSDTVQLGSPGYAPTEQYGTGQTDARSDIYSLGATLHELLTGHDPAQTPFIFAPVRSLNPRVPLAVDEAVARALESAPARRWQTAAEMRAALLRSDAAVCPRCGASNPINEIYCQKCATPLTGQKACQYCHQSMPAQAVFCPICGRRT